jgi:hypothetical protein
MNTARTLSLLLLDGGFLYYLTVDSHVAEALNICNPQVCSGAFLQDRDLFNNFLGAK